MSTFPINNILFIDIETVPQYAEYALMPEEWKTLWGLKAQYLIRNKEDETVESIYPRAGIYAEFGQVICISCGYILGSGIEKKIMIKSFFGDDEKKILYEFSEMIKKWGGDGPRYLCAHN